MLRKLTILPLVVLGLTTNFAAAQDSWPERPIKLVLPVAAGGGVDLMARILADRLSQQLSQRVLVENIGGAGGTIATRSVLNSDADGYTYLFPGPGHATIPFVYKKLTYDPINDLVGVSLVARFPLVAVVPSALPVKNAAEFIALVKANPGKFSFGSGGVGGSSHIPAELFKHLAGVDMVHVPFRGNALSSAALIAGQIHLIIDGVAPQLGNIAEGRVRVLGVTTKERSSFLPDVPALSETLPGYDFPMWVAVFAPARTPKPIINKFSVAIAAALKHPETQRRYTDVKVEPVGSTPEELDAFYREQLKFNEDIIQRANIPQVN
jgi:tripartite-type tricarboxylate transporter receptor subunit TctC